MPLALPAASFPEVAAEEFEAAGFVEVRGLRPVLAPGMLEFSDFFIFVIDLIFEGVDSEEVGTFEVGCGFLIDVVGLDEILD